jgi:hypothetical protein
MNSRAARILIPLAVELGFALVVGLIIVATDGGFYGLGTKAVMERVTARYQDCRTYTGTMREVAGEYPEKEPAIGPFDWCMRTYFLVFQRPDKAAGCLKCFGGKKVLYIQNGDREEMVLDEIGGPYVVDMPFRVQMPPPWRVGQAHQALRLKSPSGALAPRCLYVEVERRKGPDGKRYDVLIGYRRDGKTSVWIDPDDYHIRAVVRPGSTEVIDCPVTELYEDVVFDEPVDDALFDLDGEGFEKLKQWIAEREKAHTN